MLSSKIVRKPIAGGALLISLACYRASSAADTTLVGHWRFNEGTGQTTADTSTYGRTCQLGSSSSSDSADPTWVTGNEGPFALQYDGSADYCQVPDSAGLALTSMSILARIKSPTLSGTLTVIDKGSGVSVRNYAMDTVGTELQFRWRGPSNVNFSTSGLNLQTNTWYHVAGTYDDSTGAVRLYLNGVLVLSTSTTVTPVANTNALYIGRSVTGNYWPGSIDDVRIYNRALSAAEILAIKNGTEGSIRILNWAETP